VPRTIPQRCRDIWLCRLCAYFEPHPERGLGKTFRIKNVRVLLASSAVEGRCRAQAKLSKVSKSRALERRGISKAVVQFWQCSSTRFNRHGYRIPGCQRVRGAGMAIFKITIEAFVPLIPTQLSAENVLAPAQNPDPGARP
jgi:hypothetical protein